MASFPFLKTGSGADPQGALGARAGEEPEAHRGFNGTRFPGMGPTISNWGPAIDYSNLLGLKVCFPQLNVLPAILAIIPRQFQFPISAIPNYKWQVGQWDPQYELQFRNWDPQLSEQLLLGPQSQRKNELWCHFRNPNSGIGAIAMCTIGKSASSVQYESDWKWHRI